MPVDERPSVSSFPPYFGARRQVQFEPLERIDFAAGDGTPLLVHHTSGGNRGPVILAAGTAMTGLSYCIDSVKQNFVEFLVKRDFDVWLFDWRTSPLLAAHRRPYTLDDIAHYDWPAVIAEVHRRTGASRVSVLAHCLSSPAFMLGLVRGHIEPGAIKTFVASQVALHLVMTRVGQIKMMTRLDRALPATEMIHEQPAEVNSLPADLAISLLSAVIPKTYTCDNRACYRHSATFGDVIFHSRVNAATHQMMGDLIPECLTAFLKDIAPLARRVDVLNDEDHTRLGRFRLPMYFVSGSENRMFVPQSTERTYRLLTAANGTGFYNRRVFEGFGHLDCYIGEDADRIVWPHLAEYLAA